MRWFFCFYFVFLAGFSQAEDVSTGFGKISRVHFWWGIDGPLVLHSQMGRNPGCGRADQYILSANHPQYDEIYALILAASMADKSVSLVLHNKECPGSYPSIKHVYVCPDGDAC
ncbi:hypothetical protein SAMN02745866_01568 [Alteromonadaceae bacterium Bs31]|nr:hypothetical protein SAMN02745866_01568 [Alteromonadaceae bacterium Bs31]